MSIADAQQLWSEPDPERWTAALEQYPSVVAAQHIAGLIELDDWYRGELPRSIADRSPPFLERAELVRLTRWKMTRGEWRARNLALVQSNRDADVRTATMEAFEMAPDPRLPVVRLAKLAGVGAATASAALAAFCPDLYPFLDELVGAAVRQLGEPKFTVPYYVRYAEALRERAAVLGADWKAQAVGLALWSAAGGKFG
ncbi:MAG TPA: hypothetical protein VFC51_02150 [Chloroflexota bacterium]|nr:hypothetical protein [Chloroflexota bacterium]